MKAFQTAAFYTLGCKLNFSETSTIARNLAQSGYAKVDFEHGADVYVINTCSVTDNADKKCRNVVRRAHKYNPNAKVIVLGCYAQLKRILEKLAMQKPFTLPILQAIEPVRF